MTMTTAREYAQQTSIREGATVAGLGTRLVEYTIGPVDLKGYTLIRPANKAGVRGQVRVSWRMVDETLARLLAGQQVSFQGNRSKGGIDGTSAKRDGVLAALSGLALRDGNLVILAQGARDRLKASA